MKRALPGGLTEQEASYGGTALRLPESKVVRESDVNVAVTRIPVMGLAILGSVLLMYAFAVSPTRLSVLWGLGLAGVGVVLSAYATSRSRKLITPLPFAVFFVLGFVFSFAAYVQDPAAIPKLGFGAIGRFDFTDGSMVWPAQVIVAGAAAIIVATWIGERLLLPAFGAAHVNRTYRPSVPAIAAGWFLLALSVTLACAVFRLGRTGLTNETELPFALGGTLVYARDLLIPALTGFALHAAIRERRFKLATSVILAAFALAVGDSLASISRARLVSSLLVVFVALLGTDEATVRFRRRGIPVLVVLMLTSSTVIGSVNGLRAQAYRSGKVTLAEASDAVEQSSDQGKGKGWAAVASLATDRVGGIQGLLAVSGSRSRGADAAIGVLTGDPRWVNRVTLESFGFLPTTNRVLAFGVGFGFLGAISLVDSLFVVFLATVLLVLLPTLLEILFARYADGVSGQVLAVLLVLALWNEPSIFGLPRFAFMAILSMAVVLALTKRSAASSRDRDPAPARRPSLDRA